MHSNKWLPYPLQAASRQSGLQSWLNPSISGKASGEPTSVRTRDLESSNSPTGRGEEGFCLSDIVYPYRNPHRLESSGD
jgi:hypothetical protein